MPRLLALLAAALLVAPAGAIDLDVTLQDIERALQIARSRDAERARFHAPYIKTPDNAFIERAEVITEYRRVVLLAEERQRQGDRQFAYSVTQAAQAIRPWKRRVSVLVRMRFHPQNNYVSVPDISVSADGNSRAFIGVQTEPIQALPPGRTGEFVPILGAVVDATFDAEALGQKTQEFAVRLQGREVGRVTFDLANLQ